MLMIQSTLSHNDRANDHNMHDEGAVHLGAHHITYRVTGSGPDIVLVHGWLSSGRMWEGLMAHLAPKYRLWAIDLIGFGNSTTDDEQVQLNIEAQVSMIVAFCEALNIRPFAVIGHSMGGAITLKLTLDHPDLVERVGLICPVVTGRFNVVLDSVVFSPLGKQIMGLGVNLWTHIKRLPGVHFLVAPSYLKREVIARSIDDFNRASWRAVYQGLLSLTNIGLDRRLHEIRKPILFMTGTYDYTVPPTDARLGAKSIAHAQFVEFEDCHHQPPDENPERFHQVISDFLAAVGD